MAKIYGLFGAMTGKVADVVMSVRNGEQIARKYQPIVANPSTSAQVASRAKLKLMSQLSAVMGPYIAMRRVGAVSPRNMFVKENYKFASFSNDIAEVEFGSIKLTKSVVGMPNLIIGRGASNIEVGISAAPGNESLNRVVYIVFEKMADNSLRFYDSQVVETPGASYTFPTTIPSTDSSLVGYAYGIRDNTEAARATFGNLQALTAETIAKLVVSRTLLESDITLTETVSRTLSAAS